VLGIPIVGLIAGTTSVTYYQHQQSNLQAELRGLRDAETGLPTILASLLDAETGVRGFLLTGDRVFLTPFDASTRALPAELRGLTQQVSGNPGLGRIADAVSALAAPRLTTLQRLVARGPAETPEARAAQQELLLEGNDQTNQLRRLIGDLQDEASRQYDEGFASLQHVRLMISIAFVLSVSFGLIGGIAAAILMARGVVRRLHRLEGNARRLAAGEEMLPLPPAEDEIGRLGVAFEDASALLREREALKASILSSIAEGTVVTDLHGRILSINPAMESLAGWPASDVLGKQFAEVYRIVDRDGEPIPWERTRLYEAIASGLTLAPEGYERTMVAADGRRFPFGSTSAPLMDGDGRVCGGVELVRDVTREREIDQLKSSLISTVSHELRTPLTMIQGFSELLVTRSLDATSEKEALHQIRQASERLARLIDDLLSVARIESGRLAVRAEPVDIGVVIDEVVASYAGDRAVSVDLDGCPAALADRDKFVQIITNLVSNAVKYSAPGIPISISARAEGSAVHVSVSDQGIGMDEEELAHLFERFYRSERSEVRSEAGTGLGLYITRSLVELQGGQIWASSTPGEGSTFVFTLPAANERKENAA
jgi:PAS domain S-box-containing protein